MAFQIAFAWNGECEEELKKMGFEKREVYMKHAPSPLPLPGKSTYSEAQKAAGDSEFFRMRRPPFQFVTASYWGAGNGE